MGEQLTSFKSYEQRRRWLLYCPGCNELWFAPHAQDGDTHVCKGCGRRFIIEPSLRPTQATPTTKDRPPLKRAA
jgi:rRNA maturation endonuclease Nob1